MAWERERLGEHPDADADAADEEMVPWITMWRLSSFLVSATCVRLVMEVWEEQRAGRDELGHNGDANDQED